MDDLNPNKVVVVFEEIEKQKQKLEEYIASLPLQSRDNILKDIYRDIIRNNQILKSYGLSRQEEDVKLDIGQAVDNVIEKLIVKITTDPSQKEIYLKEFFKLFTDISDNDKYVILQSLIDEEAEQIKGKILALTNIFNLNI